MIRVATRDLADLCPPENSMGGLDLSGKDMRTIKLANADLPWASIDFANFKRSDLTDADLSNADAYGSNFHRADLTGANLRKADLRKTVMTDAELIGANLTGADLSNANLAGANLFGAELTGAIFSGSNLTGSFGLRWAQAGPVGAGRRTLTGVMVDGLPRLFCGCFAGTPAEFKQRVGSGGWEWPEDRVDRYATQCLKALDYVMESIR